MRALFTMAELSAMAFIMSCWPTISTTKACRAGMSKAFTKPRHEATTMISHTLMWPSSVSAERTNASNMAVGLGGDDNVIAAAPVRHHAANRGQQENRDLPGKTHQPEQQRRARQPVNQPGLRHGLHPGADQGNNLAAEKQPVIPVAEGAEHRRNAALRLPVVSRFAGGSGVVDPVRAGSIAMILSGAAHAVVARG